MTINPHSKDLEERLHYLLSMTLSYAQSNTSGTLTPENERFQG